MEDILIPAHTEMDVEVALQPPVSRCASIYFSSAAVNVADDVEAARKGVKAAMSVDIVLPNNPVRARLVNFSDNPVLIPRNTFLGEVRPATPEDITELEEASAAQARAKALEGGSRHHPHSAFSAAAQSALDAIDHEKAAGTYATANVSSATASTERTRTTQEPCTQQSCVRCCLHQVTFMT